MNRAPVTGLTRSLEFDDGDVRCPHCHGRLELKDAARFAGIAECPHEHCGRRLVVEVEGRSDDGRPVEFRVRTTAGYVHAVQPISLSSNRRWVPLVCASMAMVTTGILVAWGMRHAALFGVPSLRMLALMALMFCAASSWTVVGMGWLTDRWMRAFLWRRSLVMEAPSATLSSETGGG